jgi:hypothetical protein
LIVVTVLVVLLMGALAIGLAWLIVKPEPGARAALFGIVVVLLLIVGQFMGYRFVRPYLQATFAGASLGDEPLFRALRKYEPAMYERLERGYKAALKSGTKEEFMQSAIGEAAEMAQKYMPVASNDSVRNLMKHGVVQIKELQRKPGDVCFRFLFPQVAGPADLSVLPKSMLEANALHLEAVLLSAVEHPQPLPAETDVLTALMPIYARLTQTYGADLQMLANPAAADVDRRQVCAISVDLYDQILGLPDDQDANVLRFMLTKATG